MSIKPPFKPYTGTDPYIFVSYSHKDRNTVFPIIAHLNNKGFRVWYDEGIDPGTEWPEEIANHLADCSVFLLFITPDAMASHNVRREINMAIKHQKKLLNTILTPTELSQGMEMQLSLIQYLTYSEDEREDFLSRLDSTLQNLLGMQQPSTVEETASSSSNQNSKVLLPRRWRKTLIAVILCAILGFALYQAMGRPDIMDSPLFNNITVTGTYAPPTTPSPSIQPTQTHANLKASAGNDDTATPQVNAPTPTIEITSDSADFLFMPEGDYLGRYAGTADEVYIPYGVKGIVAYAFTNKPSVKKIIIPSSLQYIDTHAFLDSKGIQYFVVDENNPWYTSVDGVLFSKDMSTLLLYPSRNERTSYIVPEGVKSIDPQAFLSAVYLSRVQLPEGLLSIGDNAFRYSNLDSIQLPDTVIDIGKFFIDYTKIRELFIPASVQSMYEIGFYGCDYLEAFLVDPQNMKFSSKDGVLFNHDGTQLIKYPPAKPQTYYAVPMEVVSVEESAFAYNKFIQCIVMIGKTQYIGSNAFSCCEQLDEIHLPKTLKILGSGVFGDCANLSNIDLPPNLEYIGEDTFGQAVQYINIDSNNKHYASVKGVLFNKDLTTLLRYPPSNEDSYYKLPSETVRIGAKAFFGSSIQKVTFNENIRYIDENAFKDCIQLTSIDLPQGLLEIHNSAFWGCLQLKRIAIPSSVELIGDSAFSNVSSDFIIVCDQGSYAEQYAKENGLAVKIFQ